MSLVSLACGGLAIQAGLRGLGTCDVGCAANVYVELQSFSRNLQYVYEQ